MAINIEEKDVNANYISQASIAGTTYTIKDAAVRTQLSAVALSVETNTANIATNAADIDDIKKAIAGGVHYRGQITELLVDGDTTNPVTLVGGGTLSAIAGDLVHAKKDASAEKYDIEFIWNGTNWNELGSTGALKKLAFQDEVTATYTPEGGITVNAIADATYDLASGLVVGTEATLTTSFSGTQTTLQTTFTGTEVSATGSFTGTEVSPTGKVTVKEISSQTFSGTQFTPAGTVVVKEISGQTFAGDEQSLSSKLTINSVHTTAGFTGTEGSLSVLGVATGTVSKPDVNVTPAEAATGSASVANEILTISFGNALTSVTAALAAAPEFTGTQFSSTGKYTPAGSVAVTDFTPTGSVEIETVKPTGTVTLETGDVTKTLAMQSVTPEGIVTINTKEVDKTLALDKFTPGGNIAIDKFTPQGSIADITYTPGGSVADITYTPAGSVTGTVTVAGHAHTGSFSGTEATITSK